MSIGVSIAISIAFAAWLVKSSVKGSNDQQQKIEQRVQQPMPNVCVFLQSRESIDRSVELSAAFKERIKRETYGYAHAIPLGEALRIFNAELGCYPYWATLPPLNEQEVIANAIGGPDYGGESAWRSQVQVRKFIASNRMMPKGSLFVAESGGCEQDVRPGPQTCVKGLKIYLFLGLDKNPRESNLLNPDQIVLIRKTYFQTETR